MGCGSTTGSTGSSTGFTGGSAIVSGNDGGSSFVATGSVMVDLPGTGSSMGCGGSMTVVLFGAGSAGGAWGMGERSPVDDSASKRCFSIQSKLFVLGVGPNGPLNFGVFRARAPTRAAMAGTTTARASSVLRSVTVGLSMIVFGCGQGINNATARATGG
ncbi:MAG: hypothetical protein HZC54_11210 [Verrucomicrobia bacterium]|nr:hypothetical protein [Verrucomicrobiota bacterium]